MSDYHYVTALGLDSYQGGFVEEMGVGNPTPAQGASVPGSPEDHLLGGLNHDQWPPQGPRDQPGLARELSGRPSPLDMNDKGLGEELLMDDPAVGVESE